MDKAYTLYELNEFIRRVLALNFSQAVWVKAEIAQINQSRGHYFLTLIQKEASGDELVAQSDAVLWERSFRRIRRTNGKAASEVLRSGMSVKLQVRVDFNERYGLKLIIEDIDPAYTLGELELRKRATLERLQKEGLLTLNRQLPLPPVLQRIAVLSSPEAAGFQDFRTQLEENAYGYRFQQQLFPIAVQGVQVLPDLRKQLKKIGRWHGAYDCVVLIRGGGGRTDLAAFDQYEVGAALARCPLPVITGIGHEIDETVADQVAHLALKTPTAAAGFLINRCLEFEGRLQRLVLQVQQLGRRRLQTESLRLGKREQRLFFLSQQQLHEARARMNYLSEQIPRQFQYRLENERRTFDRLASAIRHLDPENLLRRGYSLTFHRGRLVRSVDQLQPGDQIRTRLADGQIDSTVDGGDSS